MLGADKASTYDAAEQTWEPPMLAATVHAQHSVETPTRGGDGGCVISRRECQKSHVVAYTQGAELGPRRHESAPQRAGMDMVLLE